MFLCRKYPVAEVSFTKDMMSRGMKFQESPQRELLHCFEKTWQL
jgi:hypothetical protein